MDYIQDRDRLQAWATYTCRERAELIEKEIGLHVHPHVLRKLYLRLNIKYRRVKLEFSVAHPETLNERRFSFA